MRESGHHDEKAHCAGLCRKDKDFSMGVVLLTAKDEAGKGSWPQIGKRSVYHAKKLELYPGNRGHIY